MQALLIYLSLREEKKPFPFIIGILGHETWYLVQRGNKSKNTAARFLKKECFQLKENCP